MSEMGWKAGKRLTGPRFKIYKEKAGVISEHPIWICIEGAYLYEHEWLIGLLWLIITEWRNDRHLVG